MLWRKHYCTSRRRVTGNKSASNTVSGRCQILGGLYWEQKTYSKAYEHYARAFAGKPKDADGWGQLCITYALWHLSWATMTPYQPT